MDGSSQSPPSNGSVNNWQLGPRAEPGWWNFLRQVVMFTLGVAVIIYGVVSTGHDVAFLVTGLILIGIIPVERAITRLTTTDAPSGAGSE